MYPNVTIINWLCVSNIYRCSILIFCPTASSVMHCHSLCAALSSNVGAWDIWTRSFSHWSVCLITTEQIDSKKLSSSFNFYDIHLTCTYMMQIDNLIKRNMIRNNNCYSHENDIKFILPKFYFESWYEPVLFSRVFPKPSHNVSSICDQINALWKIISKCA